jgi:exopolysaccharide biosynthesis polyprenyl glycosylphosphotransferase
MKRSTMFDTRDVLRTGKSLERPRQVKLSLGAAERKLLLRAVDLILICTGIFGALSLWSTTSQKSLSWSLLATQLPWIISLVVCWFLWLFVNELYEAQFSTQVDQVLKRIWLGAGIFNIGYLFYFFIISPGQVTSLRLAPVLCIVATSSLLSVWRVWYALVSEGVATQQRVLIFGAGESGVLLAKALQNHPHYQVVGFADDAEKLQGQCVLNMPVIGNRELLNSDLKSIDRIAFAVSNGADDELLGLLTSCHERGVAVTPMPVLYELLTGKVAVEHVGSQWYSALPFNRPSFESLHLVSKRALDLFCGLIIGSVFLIVLPFVVVAIKLSSPGPIFYYQERVGLHGRKFTVCKFRSMVQDAERGGKAQWSQKGDSRITPVGRFIRKTRLDELPQVINVLKGEMSMVGPRPERQQFIVGLQEEIPFYRTRLAAKPGLTGWAQVNYGYGATVEDALIKLQYDLYYLKHRSVWLDLKILLRTFAVVLKMQGQ